MSLEGVVSKAVSLSQEIWNYFAEVEMEQLFRILAILFPSQGLFYADTDVGVTLIPLQLQFVETV